MGSRVPKPCRRRNRAWTGVELLSALLLLGACGGGDPPSPDAPTVLHSAAALPDTDTPATARASGDAGARVAAHGSSAFVLDVPPGLLLASNLRDYAAPESALQAASAASVPPAYAARFVVTALPTVTVGEVSRALLAAGTRIVEMRAHDLTFSIEATDGASIHVRDRVLSRLEASRLFESVLPVN